MARPNVGADDELVTENMERTLACLIAVVRSCGFTISLNEDKSEGVVVHVVSAWERPESGCESWYCASWQGTSTMVS